MSHPRASRSCGNCRAVKRRCDRQLPQCGQCVRLREKCPGYRDEWDLVFRDQTHHTIKRSSKQRAKGTVDKRSLSPPTRQLSPSIDDVGVNYFFHHFVVNRQSSSRGCFNYIPTVYHVDGGYHPTLLASMAAVGLVSLANSTQQPHLARQARTKYSEAIQRVNLALASPVDSVKDSTLMSVISLGVFEHVSQYESWVRHVQGAAALVVARGKKQFTSPLSILMFNQVRADLVLASVHGSKPFPDDMLQLQEEAEKYTDPSSLFWRMGVVGTRCANLLMNVRKNKDNPKIPWPKFLEEISAMEQDFEYLSGILSVQEPYTTTQKAGGDPALIYAGRCDLYRDSYSIRLWNNLRNIEMIVYEIQCFLLNNILAVDLPPGVRAQLELRLEKTLHALSKMAHDIIATVPQALEFLKSASDPPPSVGLSTSTSVVGGYMLIWCLYMAGKCPATKSEPRKWVIRRLQDIGGKMGLTIALELVEHIIEIDRWAGSH